MRSTKIKICWISLLWYEGTKTLETWSDHSNDRERSLNDEKNIYSSHLRSRVAGLYSARELCVVSLLHHQLLRSHVDHRFHCEKKPRKFIRDIWQIVKMVVIFICVTQDSDLPPQTSGWGKLIKEAGTSTSLLRVLPSLFQKYFRHIINQFFSEILPSQI